MTGRKRIRIRITARHFAFFIKLHRPTTYLHRERLVIIGQCIAVVKYSLTEHHSAAVEAASEKEAANFWTFTHQRLVIRRKSLYTHADRYCLMHQ